MICLGFGVVCGVVCGGLWCGLWWFVAFDVLMHAIFYEPCMPGF